MSGFRGRATDSVLTSVFNIFLAFPQLVLALTLVSVLAPRSPSGGAHQGEWVHRIAVVILAIGIVSIPVLGRITRASALSWTQREFVTAAFLGRCILPLRMEREDKAASSGEGGKQPDIVGLVVQRRLRNLP